MGGGAKIVQLNPDLAGQFQSGSGSPSGPAGGDTSGSFPNPTVVGIGGVPVDTPDGVATDFLNGQGHWTVPTGTALTATDGTTTVASVTTETVPLGGVTSLGAGNAGLNFLTSVYGGQDKVHTVGAAGATQTLDCSTANVFDLTLTANCTLTISNPPPLEGSIVVILRQGGSGSYTVTWPGSVSWQKLTDGTSGGSAPTLWTAVGAVDVIVLTTLDGGTTWGGSPAPHGAGTVTSVGLSMPAEFAVGSSPVTGAGTIAVTKANESANTVWAGPTSGAAAAPTFRALTAADIPAGVGTTDHEHVMDCLFSGDGSTVAWELPAAPVDAYSVAAYVAGVLTEVTLSGTMLTTATFGSAPGSGTNNVRFDIVAAVL